MPFRRAACSAAGAALLVVLAGCASGGAAPAATPRTTPSPAVAAVSPRSRPPAAGGAGATPGPQWEARHPAAAGSALHTSCRSVVHIGDSTSDGLVLASYQPDARLRIAAQYQRVGVTKFVPEVSGARSIYETWHGFPNGYTVAQRLIRRGYRGCWVIALGTNDAADVAVGSAMSMPARIREMMALIGNQPVLWVNVVTRLSSGPYAESHMRTWDRDLLRACPLYPTMRVYDWAAVARPSWFIPDGIHYTPQGYAQRSRLIANALAEAFPAVQPAPGLLSGSGTRAWDTTAQQACLVH